MLSTSGDTHLGGDDFDKVSNISMPLDFFFLLCYMTVFTNTVFYLFYALDRELSIGLH